jgi:hypothetical protein
MMKIISASFTGIKKNGRNKWGLVIRDVIFSSDGSLKDAKAFLELISE